MLTTFTVVDIIILLFLKAGRYVKNKKKIYYKTHMQMRYTYFLRYSLLCESRKL